LKQYINTIHNQLLGVERGWLYGSIVLLFVYLSPLIIYGGELNFLAFDNLDSNVVWFKILAESGKIFSSNGTIIPNMMNGLPRSCYGSEYNAILWLYYFLTPKHAYITNEIVMHLVAFFSMYIFLFNYFFKSDRYRYVYSSLGALYFAMMPFWPSGGLSIPLMPLVTYVFIKIREDTDDFKLWLVLLFLPFYSSFIVVYFFYFFIVGLLFIRDTIQTRSFNTRLFVALLVTVSIFLFVEYRILLEMFIEKTFISNRVEYYSLVNDIFLDAYRNAHLQFINGVPHAKGTHLYLILPVALFALALLQIDRRLSLQKSFVFLGLFSLTYIVGVWQVVLTQIYTLPIILLLVIMLLWINRSALLPKLLLLQIVIAYWFGFAFYEGWQPLFEVWPGLKMFNFSRFFFFSQFLWPLIAVLALREIVIKIQVGVYLLIPFTIFQIYFSSINGMFSKNIQFYYLPFDKYYAQKQFSEVSEYIGKPKDSYTIINLGIDPAVAQYNGFKTLDGYMVNYPLEYKHQFRNIIAKYLDVSVHHKNLYDGWGSKVYVYDQRVNYVFPNEFFLNSFRDEQYRNLYLDTATIKSLGGDYLFSLLEIHKPEAYELTFLKAFISEESLWTVYLYKVN